MSEVTLKGSYAYSQILLLNLSSLLPTTIPTMTGQCLCCHPSFDVSICVRKSIHKKNSPKKKPAIVCEFGKTKNDEPKKMVPTVWLMIQIIDVWKDPSFMCGRNARKGMLRCPNLFRSWASSMGTKSVKEDRYTKLRRNLITDSFTCFLHCQS